MKFDRHKNQIQGDKRPHICFIDDVIADLVAQGANDRMIAGVLSA